MILLTGGIFQGKKEYAINMLTREDSPWGAQMKPEDILVFDGEKDVFDRCRLFQATYINRFNALVLQLMRRGEDPYAFTAELLENNPDVVIASDEIGCGIIPLEAEAREYRMVTGRILCVLTQQAEKVYRIVAGLGVQLK